MTVTHGPDSVAQYGVCLCKGYYKYKSWSVLSVKDQCRYECPPLFLRPSSAANFGYCKWQTTLVMHSIRLTHQWVTPHEREFLTFSMTLDRKSPQVNIFSLKIDQWVQLHGQSLAIQWNCHGFVSRSRLIAPRIGRRIKLWGMSFFHFYWSFLAWERKWERESVCVWWRESSFVFVRNSGKSENASPMWER